MDTTIELSAFLISRRATITPEGAGYPAHAPGVLARRSAGGQARPAPPSGEES